MTLELQNVSRDVNGQTHLRDISLVLEDGSLNVLLGPTLSGKTSLMRLMAGLDEPTSGRVFMKGRDVTGVPVQKRNVAMVYQQFINYPTLSVYENIASPLRIQKRPKDEIDRRVREAAELMRIAPMLQRTPLELSGGQQQRTALARALVKEAELVLLDEPLANLDYKLREELREELPRIFAESGAIMVYATTEPAEALMLGGMTAAMHEGMITQFGPTIEIYRRPHDQRTAQVFSDPPMNFLEVEIRAEVVRFGDGMTAPARGSLAGIAGGRYVVGFRPSRVKLSNPQGREVIDVTAKVAVTEITGSESFVHVDFAGQRWVALVHGVHEFAVDAPVHLSLDPEDFFVFDPDGRLVAAPELRVAV